MSRYYTGPDGTSLKDALQDAYRRNWKSARGTCLLVQAEKAVHTLRSLGADTVGAVNASPAVSRAVDVWREQGLSPATITKRLNCLKAMGIDTKGQYPKPDTKLKWWLRPEEEVSALRNLKDMRWATPENAILRDFIPWTTQTGLRIEESLRVTLGDFGPSFGDLTVPGTKTASAQRAIALSARPSSIASARLHGAKPGVLLFPIAYRDLEREWSALRTVMGWPPEATLKALRRSAARYLSLECKMPLDILRDYLGHRDIKTTMGYLRLVGGYSLEEQARFLR